MGIHGLAKVIADHAPLATKEMAMSACHRRRVAIDASMSIYQFLIAVRQQDGVQLANANGEVTSHLIGTLYRTIRMVENGLKPVYVFDGKPPALKSGELKKRSVKRDDAEKQAEAAAETGDMETVDKFSRRTVKATKEQSEECKRLLKLMGIPYIDAPCEAEAQCAAMVKWGTVDAAGSEDMDTLTFGSSILLRHLTFSEARKMPVKEITLDKVLEGLEMDMDQFIDMCILLGCDYCDAIKGIGPVRAVSLIKEHKNIENILKHLDPNKFPTPENWPYKEARELFKNPEVLDTSGQEMKWENPDEEGVVDFLVKEKEFNEDRVRTAIKKLAKTRTGKTQVGLGDFFKPVPKDPEVVAAAKRKADALAKENAKKAKTEKGKAGKGKPEAKKADSKTKKK